MDDGLVRVEVDAAIATVTICRPEALNALNEGVLKALLAELRRLSERADVRAIILTGAGDKAFVAGADIKAMASFGPDEARALSELGNAVCNCLESLPQPVIAAVNGFALGGGCEIALACDFILASDRSRFGQPEVNLGLIPGFGGTQRLVRRVAPGLARELIYTGRQVKAEEAKRIGLANEVVPGEDLLARAKQVAGTIATKGPKAVTAAKRALLLGGDKELAEGLRIERDGFAGLFETMDAKEGMAAFVEKRSPEFRGE